MCGPLRFSSATEERQAEEGFLWHTPWGSILRSAATVDLAANYHWLSQERAVAVAQREEPNFYWLPRGSTAGSRGALRRVMLWLEQGTPRQGWLIEEEEEEVAGEGEAFAYSSGGTLKLA